MAVRRIDLHTDSFCERCGAFIRRNPAKNAVYGVFEAVCAWLFLSMAVVGRGGPRSAPENALLAMLVFVLTFDGILRAWHGAVGLARLFPGRRGSRKAESA